MAIIRHMRRSAVFAGRFDSRNRLESGGIRVNMLTRRFAFVSPLRGMKAFFLKCPVTTAKCPDTTPVLPFCWYLPIK